MNTVTDTNITIIPRRYVWSFPVYAKGLRPEEREQIENAALAFVRAVFESLNAIHFDPMVFWEPSADGQSSTMTVFFDYGVIDDPDVRNLPDRHAIRLPRGHGLVWNEFRPQEG